MRPYRNGKTFQARASGGRFRLWDLDADFGCCECPWCHHLSAFRPESVADRHGFINPADFSRRVCGRCGWDSARGSVNRGDLDRAYARYLDAMQEAELGAGAGDACEDDLEILAYQLRRETRGVSELLWLHSE